jgi:glycosyltransferase involved in cell wall biosynthesis
LETYLPEVVFILFVLCFVVQLYFLLGRHIKLMSFEPATEIPAVHIPVSVVISARNEFANLQKNIPVIMEQNYPDFEVVVVNDRSFDGTHELLDEFDEKYERLKVVTVIENDKFITGKKFALTMGIKAAKNEYLLFTDADCRPASEHWISLMAANFASSAEIILGYSPYERRRGFLNAFIRFETVKTAINYCSAALKQRAYMGVGRNLAYTKSLFFKVKGFASHMHVMSGDDDLFVNQNARPDNTVLELHPDSFTYSEAKVSWGAYFRQKLRHMGAGKMYKTAHRRMLVADALTGFWLYVFFISCCVISATGIYTLIALGLLVFRWIMQFVIYSKIFRKLENQDLIWALPFFDVFYYIYLNIFGLAGSLSKTTRWK